MENTISIEFTEKELKEVLLNYYGDVAYDDGMIKTALLGI